LAGGGGHLFGLQQMEIVEFPEELLQLPQFGDPLPAAGTGDGGEILQSIAGEKAHLQSNNCTLAIAGYWLVYVRACVLVSACVLYFAHPIRGVRV